MDARTKEMLVIARAQLEIARHVTGEARKMLEYSHAHAANDVSIANDYIRDALTAIALFLQSEPIER